MHAVQFDGDRTKLFVLARCPPDQIELTVTHYEVDIVDQRYQIDRQRDRPLGLALNELKKIGRLALDDYVSIVRSTELTDQTFALIDPVHEAGLVNVLETALASARTHQLGQPALL